MRKLLSLLLLVVSLAGMAQSTQVSYFINKETLEKSKVVQSNQFNEPTEEQNIFIGNFYDKVYVRINVKDASDNKFLVINNPLYDSLEFFYQDPDTKEIESQLVGQTVPFINRQYGFQDYTFQLNSKTEDYYLKIYSSKPINLPIRVHEREGMIKNMLLSDMFFGSYIGIILVMLLYNLVLYFIVRDRSYVYYVLYIFFVGLTQTSLFGYTDRFLLPNWGWLNNNMTFIKGSLVGIFSLIFIQEFLHLKSKAPWIHRLLTLFMVIEGCALVLSLVGYRIMAYNMINSIAGIGSLVSIGVSVRLMSKGYKPAKFFLIAWSIFLSGVIIFVMKDYDVIPFNGLTRRSILIGSVMEIILLSVALADRINVLRREKEESQAEALRVSQENERIIREQNVFLEQKVQERTMELQEANEELQVTLTNLKETQSQLVDAEKMASLGQLTAGIAHEINNPINFVTSNISPLRRDLSELYEIIEAYSDVQLEKAEEGLKKARDLQEELDFDYLKDEIDSLVVGISDGANRTSEIVKGLRTFSRLDEDDAKISDLHDNLNSTMVLLKNKIGDQIHVDYDYDNEVGAIDCYPGKLNQVFMNILNNAIYAVTHNTYEEGEKATITLKTKKLEENKVEVHLIDNGIGMDEDTKKKIFEPFFTTKDVGEGTGLGMSIVFKIIEKHKGTIRVESELGKGTDFIITLPISQPNEFE